MCHTPGNVEFIGILHIKINWIPDFCINSTYQSSGYQAEGWSPLGVLSKLPKGIQHDKNSFLFSSISQINCRVHKAVQSYFFSFILLCCFWFFLSQLKAVVLLNINIDRYIAFQDSLMNRKLKRAVFVLNSFFFFWSFLSLFFNLMHFYEILYLEAIWITFFSC